jgi:hypothetical protein
VEAVLALGRLAQQGGKEAFPAIERATADQSPEVSNLAMKLLEELQQPNAAKQQS